MDGDKLICAVTDDDFARDVIDTGAAIAAAAGLEPVFVTVAEVDVSPSATVVPAGAGLGWAPFPEGSFHAAEHQAAERAAGFLRDLGVPDDDAEIRRGRPAAELNEAAHELGAVAIVVGGVPNGALKTLAMGSVARSLASDGICPVFFARPGARLDMAGPVLCGVDPHNGNAMQVAAVAARFARMLERPLVIVHVGQFGPRSERDAVRHELSEIARRFGAMPVEVDIEEGSVAERLATQAAERRASTLVVGNRGHGAIRSALGGSVSLDLARSAPQPVVVVPPNARRM